VSTFVQEATVPVKGFGALNLDTDGDTAPPIVVTLASHFAPKLKSNVVPYR